MQKIKVYARATGDWLLLGLAHGTDRDGLRTAVVFGAIGLAAGVVVAWLV